MSGQDTESFIGFAVFFLGLAWSWIEKRRATGNQQGGPSSLLCLAIALCLMSQGCARFSSVQRRPDGTETRQDLTTFLCSKSHVAKIRATMTDKTQGLTIGAIDQESNASDLVGAAVRAAIEASK